MNKSEKFWDKQSNSYETQVSDHLITVIEKIRQYLTSDDVALDYACATGLVAHGVAEHVKEIHGLDISSKMIAIAQQIATERNIDNAHFSHGTIFDERYTKESFDVILAFNILHLVEDAPTIVGRIYDLLKPGGVFISKTPSIKGTASIMGIAQVALRTIGLVPHLNMPKMSELENLITSANFQIVESENLSPKAPFSYLVVAKKL